MSVPAAAAATSRTSRLTRWTEHIATMAIITCLAFALTYGPPGASSAPGSAGASGSSGSGSTGSGTSAAHGRRDGGSAGDAAGAKAGSGSAAHLDGLAQTTCSGSSGNCQATGAAGASGAGGGSTAGGGEGPASSTTTTAPLRPGPTACSLPGSPFATGPPAGLIGSRATNLTYGPQPLEVLDVEVPAGAVGRPAILLLHGGGWISGDKSEMATAADYFTQNGFVTFNADYTLADATHPGYPNQLDEVEQAVSWIRAHAGQYGVDPTRIGVLGASAGGTLSALLGTVPGGSCASGVRVAAVASWSGPMDLTSLDQGALGCPSGDCRINYAGIAAFAGCDIWSHCPSLFTAASPLTHVTADSAPMIIYNSSAEVIPLPQAQGMASAMQAAGAPVALHVLPGSAHATGYSGQALPDTLAWFREWLG